MLEREHTNEVLHRFITHVVNQSKRNLTLKSINKTKSLHKSIKGDLDVNKNSFSIDFFMNDYGKFIDRGVKGVGGKGVKLKNVRRVGLWRNENYKFRDKMPPTRAFKTDKINRPLTLSQRFAVANTVYRQGIETTEFFSGPFEAAFKNLPQELIEAYGLDVEDFIEFALKENK